MGNPNNLQPSNEASNVSNMKKIEDMKFYAVKIPLNAGMSFDKAVTLLLEYKRKGTNGFINFNGKFLYAIDITCKDDAYLLCFGKTEKDYNAYIKGEIQGIIEKAQDLELEATLKIPDWVEKGKKYIEKGKWETRENYVKSCVKTSLYGRNIDCIIKILESIDKGVEREDIQKMFNNPSYTDIPYSMIRGNIVYFSKKGEEADKFLNCHILSIGNLGQKV